MSSKILEKLDEINKAAPLLEKIDENQILLVVISTVVMMAKENCLNKEYYHWTQSYLQHVLDEEGRPLTNIQGLIQKIIKIEKDLGIPDELLKSEICDPTPLFEINSPATSEEVSLTSCENVKILPSSTPRNSL